MALFICGNLSSNFPGPKLQTRGADYEAVSHRGLFRGVSLKHVTLNAIEMHFKFSNQIIQGILTEVDALISISSQQVLSEEDSSTT